MSVGRAKWVWSSPMTSLSPNVITSSDPSLVNLKIWLAQSSTIQDVALGVVWVHGDLVRPHEKVIPLRPGLHELTITVQDEHEMAGRVVGVGARSRALGGEGSCKSPP